VQLPTGLAGAYRELSYRGLEAHDRLTSLVWLRLLTDPAAPTVAGHDPRTILDQPIVWPIPANGELLDLFSGRLNWNMGHDLLSVDWQELPAAVVERVVHEVGRWRPEPHIGDQLGYVSQQTRSESTKSAAGAFYTPYSVSLLMAKMTEPGPGESVLDPCCGSGSMLLAALEACREKHGPDQVPELYGIDIDPVAVRLCRLNLALAGVHPGYRIECRNALLLPPEQLSPLQREMQLAMFEYEAGEIVGWRQRGTA
jgi:hypothetical protein